MWKEFLWKNFVENFLNIACGKKPKFQHGGCGEKSAAALSEILLFHINFPYYC